MRTLFHYLYSPIKLYVYENDRTRFDVFCVNKRDFKHALRTAYVSSIRLLLHRDNPGAHPLCGMSVITRQFEYHAHIHLIADQKLFFPKNIRSSSSQNVYARVLYTIYYCQRSTKLRSTRIPIYIVNNIMIIYVWQWTVGDRLHLSSYFFPISHSYRLRQIYSTRVPTYTIIFLVFMDFICKDYTIMVSRVLRTLCFNSISTYTIAAAAATFIMHYIHSIIKIFEFIAQYNIICTL